jgi:integrase/recombinase XerD
MNFRDYLKQQEYASNTVSVIQRLVNPFLEWLQKQNIAPQHVTHTDILAYIGHKRRHQISTATIRNYLNAIKIYYHYLQEIEQIEDHPIPKIELKGSKRTTLYPNIEPLELQTIYRKFEANNLTQKRNKAMAGLLIYQGITTGELDKLTLHHLDLRAGTITLPESKRINQRTLSLEPAQMMDLYQYTITTRKELLILRKIETDQLFITLYKGQLLTTATTEIYKELKKHYPQLIRLRHLRSSAIVKWLRQYNLREAQYRAGHKFVSSTEKYLQSEMQGLTEEVNQYHPLG